jgi:hypothetical protein
VEFIVCFLLAALFTGGRAASDIIHGLKGTTPPHLEKARLKAATQAARTPKSPRARSPYAEGKPRLRDVAARYWGDAMADAITAHDRRRDEKRAQRTEDADARREGRTPGRIRPGVKDRAKRFGRWLINPIGEGREQQTDITDTKENHMVNESTQRERDARTGAAEADAKEAEQMGDRERAAKIRDGERVNQHFDWGHDQSAREAMAEREARQGRPETSRPAASSSSSGAPTGEAVNYETTVAELEALIERLREHLESTTAAAKALQEAKVQVNNSQTSYNPAAAAAASISEHLTALNLDAETVGHAGTVANAMPPNDVNLMFDQLEAMEAKALEQQANAEAALGSAEQELKVVQEKYGDANNTVASELAGDSRFLAGSSVGA